MKRKKNGFTLVELLAVIVVLAIIMIIAIPSVLEVMNNARRNSFKLYIEKVVTAVQTQYVSDSNGGEIQGAGYYVYDITQDLKLTSTGDYKGFVVVDAQDVDEPNYYINMYDSNYMIVGWNVTSRGMPDTDTEDCIVDYNKDVVNDKMLTSVRACKVATLQLDLSDNSVTCYNRHNFALSEGKGNSDSADNN